ncbi:MAG: glycerol kinase GlpK [Bacteroidetes bacterium]|nr:glycerol kinase GlpK [Bacteroidota bacterium]
MEKKQQYIGAIDQGTTSTRFILFNKNGVLIASHQLEHKQIFPKPGRVEHDPMEIWDNTVVVIQKTLEKSGIAADEISGIGITNQRETVVAWDPKTGKHYYNAIVWQDLRGKPFIDGLIAEQGIDGLREKTGLTLSPYFAGSKIRWMLDNVEGLRRKASEGKVMFGTMDTWLIWNLTGGTSGGICITDFTNASRYQLMDLAKLCWDKELLDLYEIPENSLPEIKPSMGIIYGYTDTTILAGGSVPLCGILGDQQSALFGQACFSEGMAKNTYGTGCFLLVNTGEKLCQSTQGLLTTAAYHKAGEIPKYALEGSIAVAGSLVQWVRDNLGLVKTAPELDVLAESVEDNGGVYFVPAFSGLFAPYWRSDARGVIAGLTGYANSGHIARAVLEATAYQAYDIFGAVEKDSGIHLNELRVDGGLTNSRLLMQFQADILNIPVVRPAVKETTALGAAYAAGLSTGYWESEEELSRQWREDLRWTPGMGEQERTALIRDWHKAVERTLNWSD